MPVSTSHAQSGAPRADDATPFFDEAAAALDAEEGRGAGEAAQESPGAYLRLAWSSLLTALALALSAIFGGGHAAGGLRGTLAARGAGLRTEWPSRLYFLACAVLYAAHAVLLLVMPSWLRLGDAPLSILRDPMAQTLWGMTAVCLAVLQTACAVTAEGGGVWRVSGIVATVWAAAWATALACAWVMTHGAFTPPLPWLVVIVGQLLMISHRFAPRIERAPVATRLSAAIAAADADLAQRADHLRLVPPIAGASGAPGGATPAAGPGAASRNGPSDAAAQSSHAS